MFPWERISNSYYNSRTSGTSEISVKLVVHEQELTFFHSIISNKYIIAYFLGP